MLTIPLNSKSFAQDNMNHQEKDKPSRELHPGDVVEIAPDVVHWHGASPDSWFSHIAIECNPENNKAIWLEPVDEEQYKAATSKETKSIIESTF